MNFVVFDTCCVSLENVRMIELDNHCIIFHYSTRSPIYYETSKKRTIPKGGGEFETATVSFKDEEMAKENFEKVKKMLDK